MEPNPVKKFSTRISDYVSTTVCHIHRTLTKRVTCNSNTLFYIGRVYCSIKSLLSLDWCMKYTVLKKLYQNLQWICKIIERIVERISCTNLLQSLRNGTNIYFLSDRIKFFVFLSPSCGSHGNNYRWISKEELYSVPLVREHLNMSCRQVSKGCKFKPMHEQ